MKYAKSGSVAKDRLKQILAKNDLNIKLKYDILLSTKGHCPKFCVNVNRI